MRLIYVVRSATLQSEANASGDAPRFRAVQDARFLRGMRDEAAKHGAVIDESTIQCLDNGEIDVDGHPAWLTTFEAQADAPDAAYPELRE